MANILDGIRRWVDNEPEDAIPQQIRQAQNNKSESELFLQRLLNEVEAVLKNEIVRVPNTNKAYAPEKFIVYLSEDADRSLRRDKREFFENGLSVMIFERAKELAGKLQLTAKKMTVEIAVNPALDDDIEVRAVSKSELETVNVKNAAQDAPPQASPETAQTPNAPPANAPDATIDDYGTVKDARAQLGILYYAEIRRENRLLGEFPIIQKQNTIGREGDGDNQPNLRLPTDNRKISRFHAQIDLIETDEIWVTALHKNPTIVSGQVIRAGERAQLGADGEIMIYDFTIRLKF